MGFPGVSALGMIISGGRHTGQGLWRRGEGGQLSAPQGRGVEFGNSHLLESQDRISVVWVSLLNFFPCSEIFGSLNRPKQMKIQGHVGRVRDH